MQRTNIELISEFNTKYQQLETWLKDENNKAAIYYSLIEQFQDMMRHSEWILRKEENDCANDFANLRLGEGEHALKRKKLSDFLIHRIADMDAVLSFIAAFKPFAEGSRKICTKILLYKKYI